MPHRTTDNARDRAQARDHGLRRVRTITGWITAASAAGAVVLAGGYAQAMPGKAATATPVPGHTGSGGPASAASSPATASHPSSAPSSSAASHTGSAATSSAASPAPAPATSSAPALQPPPQAPTTAASTAQATSGGS